MFVLWKIIVLLNYFSFFVDCQFELQYLGHDITLDEYNDLEVGCQTKICLLDSQRLLLAATQNETIEPCDDFEEFSIGQSKKLGALNDRYQLYGFYNEVHLLRMNRYRKVLQPKINDQDIKPFKIAKNFYQNCINSGNIY